MQRYYAQDIVYRIDTVQELCSESIIIFGLKGGLSFEVCKNLILSGIKNLILVEDGKIDNIDIKTGFCYDEKDINKYRHDILCSKLKDLNSECNIEFCKLEDTNYTNKFVVICNLTIDETLIISKICRDQLIKYVYANTRTDGSWGFIFVDGIDYHNYFDYTNYASYLPIVLKEIDRNGIVTCVDYTPHNLENNDIIIFKNLEGYNIDFLTNIIKENVNCWIDWEIEVISKFRFKLKDFNNTNDFKLLNGYAYKNVLQQTVNFNSFEDELLNPTIHENKELLLNFKENYINSIDESIETVPLNSIFGGLACMEIIKLIINNYNPINQWFVYSDPSITKCLNTNNKLDLLIIGCGSLGNEIIKNLSKLNCCNELTITDFDKVKLNNLSTQCLFNKDDVDKFKSDVIRKKLNDKIKISNYNEEFNPNNRNLNDILGKNDGVIGAVDNNYTRQLIDTKCKLFGKAFFNSGIDEMLGNVQSIIPFKTEFYNDFIDVTSERDYPGCVIESFPMIKEHTFIWSKNLFEKLFIELPTQLNNYMDTNNYSESSKEYIIKSIIKHNSSNWKSYIKWAFEIFDEYFNQKITSIINLSISEDHDKFWLGGKKCPNIKDYNLTEDMIIFLKSTTNLLCKINNIDFNINHGDYINEINKIIIDESTKTLCKDLVNIDLSERDEKYKCIILNLCDDDDDIINFILSSSKLRCYNFRINEEYNKLDIEKFITNSIPKVIPITCIIGGLVTIEILKYNSKLDVDFRNSYINLCNNFFVYSKTMSPKNTIKIGNKQLTGWNNIEINEDLEIINLTKKYEDFFESKINGIYFNGKILYSEMYKLNNNKQLSLLFENKYQIDLSKNINFIQIDIENHDDIINVMINLIK